MAWQDHVEPDWFHEAPFYLAAAIAHGALLTLNPMINWGSLAAPEKAVPIEFVAEVPPPSIVAPAPPIPALVPGGDGTDGAPRHGPGKLVAEKVKRGAVDAPPKPKPVPKPAAVKSARDKAGSTVNKAKAAAKPKPLAKPVDDRAAKFAREAQAESRRLRAEKDRAARAAVAEKAAAARAEKERRTAELRAIAAERAEAERAEKSRLAAEARAEKERRAALARAEAERAAHERAEAAARKAAAAAEQKRLAAEAAAAKAAKRAALTSALATMADPDEALEAAPSASSGRGSARKGKPARGGPASQGAAGPGADGDDVAGDGGGLGGGAAELAGARRAGAAAALAESTDPGDAGGSGGADLIDSPAKGGGIGPEGGGVSWSLDGPIGDRRVLTRVAPQSPDWVATRNLDLTVIVRFQVLPDGSVKPGAVIQKTSGFPEIDARALKALSKWRFQPVKPTPGAPEVWGRVSFRFTS